MGPDVGRATYVQIGQLIAKRRKSVGLSQADVAASVGLTRTSISNIETGRQKMLVHTLLDIADALEVPAASLLPSHAEDAQPLPFTGKDLSETDRARIVAIVNAISKRTS